MDSRFTSSGALALSLAAHVFVFGVGSLARSGLASRSSAPARGPETALEIEALPGEAVDVGIGVRNADPLSVVVASLDDRPWEGLTLVARPDFGPGARGGSERCPEPAHNLAASIDDITLSRSVLDNVIMNQVARAADGAARRSPDDRMARRSPGDDAWSAPPSKQAVGRFESADAEFARAQLGSIWQPARGTAPALRGASAAFPLIDDPPQSGSDASAARASERTARTSRRAAPPSGGVPAANRDRSAVVSDLRGAASDDLSSAEQARNAIPALMHASTAGGPLGMGRGGEVGALRSGFGGEGTYGSRARASGGGSGFGLDVRLDDYARRLQASVEWNDAFPRWAIAQGRGGIAVVGLTILADGSLAETHIVRQSGVPEFDRNVVDAIRRAAPFEPLPLGRRALAVRFVFDATNPAVGRSGSGPGGRSE